MNNDKYNYRQLLNYNGYIDNINNRIKFLTDCYVYSGINCPNLISPTVLCNTVNNTTLISNYINGSVINTTTLSSNNIYANQSIITSLSSLSLYSTTVNSNIESNNITSNSVISNTFKSDQISNSQITSNTISSITVQSNFSNIDSLNVSTLNINSIESLNININTLTSISILGNYIYSDIISGESININTKISTINISCPSININNIYINNLINSLSSPSELHNNNLFRTGQIIRIVSRPQNQINLNQMAARQYHSNTDASTIILKLLINNEGVIWECDNKFLEYSNGTLYIDDLELLIKPSEYLITIMITKYSFLFLSAIDLLRGTEKRIAKSIKDSFKFNINHSNVLYYDIEPMNSILLYKKLSELYNNKYLIPLNLSQEPVSEITLFGPNPYYISSDYIEFGATVIDALDGNIPYKSYRSIYISQDGNRAYRNISNKKPIFLLEEEITCPIQLSKRSLSWTFSSWIYVCSGSYNIFTWGAAKFYLDPETYNPVLEIGQYKNIISESIKLNTWYYIGCTISNANSSICINKVIYTPQFMPFVPSAQYISLGSSNGKMVSPIISDTPYKFLYKFINNVVETDLLFKIISNIEIVSKTYIKEMKTIIDYNPILFIKLKGPTDYYVKINTEYKEFGADSSDPYVISYNKPIDTSWYNAYTVTYTTSNNNDKTFVNRNVYIVDNIPYFNYKMNELNYLLYNIEFDGSNGWSAEAFIIIHKFPCIIFNLGGLIELTINIDTVSINYNGDIYSAFYDIELNNKIHICWTSNNIASIIYINGITKMIGAPVIENKINNIYMGSPIKGGGFTILQPCVIPFLKYKSDFIVSQNLYDKSAVMWIENNIGISELHI